ncbi:MAG: DoxX family protein [Proteobacteria bacterium]|nr:DoxX family protein [Pseudomonadota bacterium]
MLAPATEALVRLACGLALVMHGYPKLFGGTQRNAEFFAQAGFKPGLFWAIVVGTTETLGGACLAAGLFTRAVCVPIAIFLATAVIYHWQFGFNWINRGNEYPLILFLLAMHFLARGGGPWSLDAMRGGGAE